MNTRPIFTLALLALVAPCVQGGDWPMLGRDSSRNPVSLEKGPPLIWRLERRDANGKVVRPAHNIKWSADLGSAGAVPPVVAGGLVWIGTNNQRPRDPKVKGDHSVLMCFREIDGKFLWQYASPRLDNQDQDSQKAGMNCCPLADGDRLYFTTNRAEVLCFDIADLRKGAGLPRQVWKLDLRKQLGVAPATPSCFAEIRYTCSIGAPWKGRLYVTTGNGVAQSTGKVANAKAPSLVCLEAKTGKVLWQDNSPGKDIMDQQWSSPLVVPIKGRTQVIVGQGDGWVRSFDPLTGKLLWKFDTNPKGAVYKRGGGGGRNPVLATPVFQDGKVYVGNGRGADHGSGPGSIWCIDPTGSGDVSPEVEDKPGKFKRNPRSRAVWLFDQWPNKGEINSDLRTVASIAVHDGLAIVPVQDGYLHCLDAKTGKRYWTHDLLARTRGSPLVIDGKIDWGAEDGKMVVLDLARQKKVLAENDCRAPVDASPVFANGALYVVSGARLHAIAAPIRPPARQPGPPRRATDHRPSDNRGPSRNGRSGLE